ncbi:pentatricopeptide repeat-containing protein At2g35030, mitochondrial [Ananas comosus]|uniref:Pentatricopeptide repeat-containing protein At2g35030, mitochondrial n=1 Tax=Ananas comosus TaxID=4615 RepID=A0A6P5EKP5_ANACO|nr:pentatricopeptide repeat-containing protein At2g35030, mitochondrial [Ananas comosus]
MRRASLRLLGTLKPSLRFSCLSALLLRSLTLSLHHLASSSPSSTNGGGGTPPPISSPLRSEDRSADAAVARSNHAITRLSRLGRMADARHLFDRTPHRDVISWTAIISGYARYGMLREARLLFDRADARKNVVTWTALLSGYVRSGRLKEAEELFEQMPERNVVSWNTMVSGYIESGLVDQGYELFKQMPERNVVSWNAIITALAQSGRIVKAYDLFRSMPERDVISWTAIVAGLAQNGKVDDARDVFDQMPQRNVVSWNAMISGYAQNRRLHEALDLFQKMPKRDIPSWNTMITGLIQNGCLNRARDLFDRMKDRNVITWTAMISGYVQDGQNELALKMFVEMLSNCVNPNQGTFVSALDAVSNLAALQEGQQIHQIISKTIFQFDPFVESALMNVYAKCGQICIARKVFDMSKRKDLVSWNGIIAAYGHHGNGREAVSLFEDMQKNGFKPNDVTYVGLLSACSHSGLVDEGLRIFNSLIKDGSIEVREDHYACLIDLCGRAGRLEEAKNLINKLNIKPSSGCVWGALIAGCNVHGNESIGKVAAKKLLEAKPNNAGTYMLLSNIYASAGKWREVAKIKLKMKDKGLKKQPGCSWIEVGNRVHVFVVCDKSHGESDLIYSLLQDLHHKMKMDGYTPDMSWINK